MAGGPSRIAHGGKALYGARVGTLMLEAMLEARFPCTPGDMGNGLTWLFPAPRYFGPPGSGPHEWRER